MTEQETIFVKILVPQKPFAVKEVLSVKIPAVEGPYMVLPKRAPAIKLLTDGLVVLTDEDGKTEQYFITAGVAKIRENACTVLTKEIIDVSKVDLDDVKKKLAYYEDRKSRVPLHAVETSKFAFLQMIVGYFEKRNLS